MPILAVMLAAAVHCADPGYCPSADQLRHAYESWFHQDLDKTSEAFSASGAIVPFDPLPVLSVSGARCGKPAQAIAGNPRAIRCTATFNYANHRERRLLLLAQTDQGWIVQERLDRDRH